MFGLPLHTPPQQAEAVAEQLAAHQPLEIDRTQNRLLDNSEEGDEGGRGRAHPETPWDEARVGAAVWGRWPGQMLLVCNAVMLMVRVVLTLLTRSQLTDESTQILSLDLASCSGSDDLEARMLAQFASYTRAGAACIASYCCMHSSNLDHEHVQVLLTSQCKRPRSGQKPEAHTR